MTPPPIVLGLTICEKVIIEEGTKNVTLVSTFTKFTVEEFPSRSHRVAVYTVLTDGLGDATMDLWLARQDTGEVIQRLRGQIHFPDRLAEVRVLFRLNDCSFPAPGEYQFTLLADGEWLAQRQLQVIERQA
jgi:hypothetical protein